MITTFDDLFSFVSAPPQVNATVCTPAQRLSLIKSTCEGYNSKRDDSIFQSPTNFARFFVMKNEKKIYCGVQSTGSRNWRSIINEALELKPGEIYNQQLVAHKDKLREKGIGYLSEFTAEDIREMLEDKSYQRILVIRHPLARFMSAYRTRVQNGPMWKLKKLKKALEENLGAKVDGYNITLGQFAAFVTHEDSMDADRYWQTYQYLCFPCTVDFTDVLKGEVNELHMDEDTIEETKTSRKFMGSRPLVALAQLNQTELDQLVAHYKKDMDMFGYGWNTPWYRATCNQTPTDNSSQFCCWCIVIFIFLFIFLSFCCCFFFSCFLLFLFFILFYLLIYFFFMYCYIHLPFHFFFWFCFVLCYCILFHFIFLLVESFFHKPWWIVSPCTPETMAWSLHSQLIPAGKTN